MGAKPDLSVGQGSCVACLAKSSCVLGPLGEDGLRGIGHFLQVEPKGQIFHQGMPILGWYIFCRGKAKLVRHTVRGKRLVLRFAKLGDLLNLAILGLHPFSAEAVDHCRVGFVERERVFPFLREHPELLREALRRFSFWEERLLQRLEALATLGMRERLIQVLLELGEEHGIREGKGLRIDLPLSQQDLADLVGASRQTICWELQKLEKKGLVQVEVRRIILTDQKDRTVQGDECPLTLKRLIMYEFPRYLSKR
ncbi:MAG: Crp/Fnr family transcriptional regulator [Candidatus Bipolaricaulaceae bacterium]